MPCSCNNLNKLFHQHDQQVKKYRLITNKYIKNKQNDIIKRKKHNPKQFAILSHAVVSSTTLVTNPIRETNGFQIQINWDSSVAETDKTFVIQAAQQLVDLITTPLIHTITVMNMTTGLGESETSLITLTYEELKLIYNPNQNSITKLVSEFNLPSTDPFPSSIYILTPTQYMAFGGTGISPGSSIVLLNFALQTIYNMTSIALHEITETMGRIGGYTQSGTVYHSLMDLCSFSAKNTRSDDYVQGGYFSPDNGTTNYSFFNTDTAGDSRDWSGETLPTDCCNAFATQDTNLQLSTNDLAVLEALGYFLSSVLCTPSTLTTTINTSITVPTNFDSLLNATFTIDPTLPLGVTLQDGIIQGMSSTTLNQTEFTINVGSDFVSEQGPFVLTVNTDGTTTSSGLSAGAIVGIVLGSVGFVVLLGVIAYLISPKNNQK